ncbi:MAG: hypothetical protein HND58_03735 [Planctomycetota bacterium]|nr:MAG: hypothetical protein HND58_03735 [Planctomycetota bacterium]
MRAGSERVSIGCHQSVHPMRLVVGDLTGDRLHALGVVRPQHERAADPRVLLLVLADRFVEIIDADQSLGPDRGLGRRRADRHRREHQLEALRRRDRRPAAPGREPRALQERQQQRVVVGLQHDAGHRDDLVLERLFLDDLFDGRLFFAVGALLFFFERRTRGHQQRAERPLHGPLDSRQVVGLVEPRGERAVGPAQRHEPAQTAEHHQRRQRRGQDGLDDGERSAGHGLPIPPRPRCRCP